MSKLFKDRIEAGQLLTKKLLQYKNNKDTFVLALPRGGVPVGFQVAKELNIPLDVFLVRKLGTPGQEELAMGAIASGGVIIYNDDVIGLLDISPQEIEAVKDEELEILKHREELYHRNVEKLPIKNKIIILIDDGIATGATIRAAIKALKKLNSKKIIVATPVIPRETYNGLLHEVDEVIYLEMPAPFYAIGAYYESFTQTSDDEVQDLLRQSRN